MDIIELLVGAKRDTFVDQIDNTMDWRNSINDVFSDAGSNVLAANSAATAADVLNSGNYSEANIIKAVRDAAFEAKDKWLAENIEKSKEEKNAAVLQILTDHGITTGSDGQLIDTATFDYYEMADANGMIGRDISIIEGDDSGGSGSPATAVEAILGAVGAIGGIFSGGDDSPSPTNEPVPANPVVPSSPPLDINQATQEEIDALVDEINNNTKTAKEVAELYGISEQAVNDYVVLQNTVTVVPADPVVPVDPALPGDTGDPLFGDEMIYEYQGNGVFTNTVTGVSNYVDLGDNESSYKVGDMYSGANGNVSADQDNIVTTPLIPTVATAPDNNNIFTGPLTAAAVAAAAAAPAVDVLTATAQV